MRTTREHDVKFIRLWFADILGNLKGFAITVEELEDALQRGVAFDGSSIEGFARLDESDMVAKPDPATFRILRWRPRENAVARMFCDILRPSGEPFEGDPRHVLKRNVKRAAEMGYTCYVGPEIEYFYLSGPENPQLLDHGGYFDQLPSEHISDLRRETVLTLAEMGIPVKYSYHEAAPSQQEIDLQYTDAITMADSIMTAKLVIKEVASKHDVYATFMPKPVYGINGSGMHVHQSLFRGDHNAFYDPGDSYRLSPVGKLFTAGLMRHAPEITLVTNQWVNSYKRLVPGYEAPLYISWARVNRSDLIRIPAYKPGREDSVHIEYRAPDVACKPYLAFSVMLAAGLLGIRSEYEVPPPVEQNAFEMGEEERIRRGIGKLPASLGEAILLAEPSELLRQSLGDHVFRILIQNKRIERDRFRAQVTDYEIKSGTFPFSSRVNRRYVQRAVVVGKVASEVELQDINPQLREVSTVGSTHQLTPDSIMPF